MRHSLILLAVVGLLAAAGARPADAQIYRWTDERGVPHYSEGLDSVPERYRSQAVPLGFRNAPAPSPAPATAPPGPGAPSGPKGAGGTTIQFKPGDRIMADARINGTTSVRLLLDTGADRTLISPRALTAAGVSLTRGTVPAQIVGATGTAEAQGVVVDSLEVGDARVGRLGVVAHDLDQSGIDGLLGRDFLEQFKVTIDSAAGVVTIAPK
ncbi:MAG: aspartyl protease family protein [Candidatus Rokubacteria bacterium]|nr:aspartyl protease family protein [Candidatus Rokubacteria bacterium]